MKRGRGVFDNLIRKASALFSAVLIVTMLTGCGDSITRYLQNNNLMDPDSYKDDADASFWESMPEEELAKDTGSSSSKPVFDASSPFNKKEEEAKDKSDASSEGDTNDTASSDEDSLDAEKTDEAADETPTENSSDSATIDIDSVNKKIDDLINQLEEETGRTNRSEDVTVEEGGKGQDATTYFSDTYQNAQRNSLGLTTLDIPALKASQQGKYAYEHLTDEGKTLYVELLTIIEHRAEDVVVSTLDEETLDVVCSFVLADHPEIFYMDGYTYTRYTIGGELKKLSFTGNYIYGADEVLTRQGKIDAYAANCIAGMPTDGDDYSKVKYIYDYLVTNTDYDSSAPDNQNICSVFLYGKSVCQGYAKATQYLLNLVGIPTTLVTGKVNGVGHAWNLVYADGEYTYVDTTWGDSSYQRIESGDTAQKMPLINYTYLCCTTQDISKTHVIAETLPMPDCTSMRNNYYVREGEYFTETDMNAVANLFSRRYADGSNNVTIKCSTKNAYDDLINRLINEQQVFSYMDGSNNTVSYTTFDEQYILIIWLY